MGEERERERERDEERKRKKERDILHLVVIEAKFNTIEKKIRGERAHNTFIRARTLARIRLHDVSFTIDKTVQIANLSRARALLDASRLPRRVRPPKFAR